MKLPYEKWGDRCPLARLPQNANSSDECIILQSNLPTLYDTWTTFKAAIKHNTYYENDILSP